jgi:APA family basic amino acid/polyamine antiporter
MVSAVHAITGYNLPTWLNAYPLTDLFSLSPLSGLIVLLCTAILLSGVKESARFNIGITSFNITIIIFIIILGAFKVDVNNWSPFLPFGMEGVLRGTGTVFFSYIGFDSVSTLSGEVANPKRDLPLGNPFYNIHLYVSSISIFIYSLGIVGTLLIATVLYVGVCLVFTGIIIVVIILHSNDMLFSRNVEPRLSSYFSRSDGTIDFFAIVLRDGHS